MSRSGHTIDGLRVAQARLAQELTQAELADRVGVHRVTLTQIENGKARASLELLESLAATLGCTREHLLGEPDQVNAIDAARTRFADALTKIGDGIEGLADLVEALNQEARAVADVAKDVA